MHVSGERVPAAGTRELRSARELLGVAADADGPTLTRAYWRGARRHHPDLSPDPAATEQFQALHAAYQLALHAALNPSPSKASSPYIQPEDSLDGTLPASPPMLMVDCEQVRTRADGWEFRVSVPSAAGPRSPTPDNTTGWVTLGSAAERAHGVWVAAGPVYVHSPRRPDTMRDS